MKLDRVDVISALGIVAIFVLALRGDVYALTSPPALSWHVALRKIYSIIAFGIIGATLARSLGARGRPIATIWIGAAVAAYSLAIELAQERSGSHEGIAWSAFDVSCGAVGGYLGATITKRTLRLR